MSVTTQLCGCWFGFTWASVFFASVHYVFIVPCVPGCVCVWEIMGDITPKLDADSLKPCEQQSG